MMNNYKVEEIVKLLRKRAKFVNVSHSDDFISDEILNFAKFYYVNLYDEKIDSNVLRVNESLIIIHNTYLSSFSYNLSLTWLYSVEKNPIESESNSSILELLLKHNYKKLFAEQLYFFRNSIFSRSILLETLLYEQEIMIDVFHQKNSNSALSDKADHLANLFSNLLSNHELAHIYLDSYEDFWTAYLSKQDILLQKHMEDLAGKYPKIFEEEIKCDTIAVYNCIQLYSEDYELGYLLNGVIWGFCSFATIYSLVKSAEYTSKEHRKTNEFVDFRSIKSYQRDYDYFIGRFEDFIERAKVVINLCTKIAAANNVEIFAANKEFPLPQDILEYQLTFLEKVMENDDENARRMSMLVAESLYQHPEGIEYLYLRSKTFNSNRDELNL